MGSASEIRQYVAERGAALTRAAFLLTGNRQDAEDLVQETYVAMVRHWRRIDSINPDPYVRRIMYSRFVDGWRRQRGVTEHPTAEVGDPVGGPRWSADTTHAADDRVVLQAALLQLTPRQRALLVLRYYEDLTEVQAAQVLGISSNTVKSQTRVALQRLRERAPAAISSFTLPIEEAVQ
jgi:RNA polymerase sigma-70 factor (sigma-E family)